MYTSCQIHTRNSIGAVQPDVEQEQVGENVDEICKKIKDNTVEPRQSKLR